MPGSGTPESLQSLTRQDFVDFHGRYFVPNNALVAVVGDIGATVFAKLVANDLVIAVPDLRSQLVP